jgi:hypothetical protein
MTLHARCDVDKIGLCAVEQVARVGEEGRAKALSRRFGLRRIEVADRHELGSL